MNLELQQQIFTQNVAALIIYIHSINFKCTFGEAFRSQEQAAIYAKEGKGIVDSLHCHRLAIDLNIFDDDNIYLATLNDKFEMIGKFWEDLHPSNRWGGRWTHRSDSNHFEMKEIS